MSYTRPLDYIDVAERLQEMREKFPDLTMQQVSMEFRTFAGKDWIVYVAAAYRTPDDPRPGIGSAWEPVPGPTPYTKDSEVQNAETSAWGRALIAIGASTKNGIASAEEISNRTGEQPTRAPQQVQQVQRPAEPASDDIELILQAAEIGTNTFVNDLAKKYRQYGRLTENQIAKGVEAAAKVVTNPRSAPTAPTAEVPWPDEEPF